MNRKVVVVFVLCMGLLNVSGCKRKQASSSVQVQVAQLSQHSTLWRFQSTVMPRHSTWVSVPYAGVVSRVLVQPGAQVQSGQAVFEMVSPALAEAYRRKLIAYVQAKHTYHQAQLAFKGTQALYAAGAVDRETFDSEQSALQNRSLALVNEEESLLAFMQLLPKEARVDWRALDLAQSDHLRALLKRSVGHMVVRADAAGLLWLPDAKTLSDSKPLQVGQALKQGAHPFAVGDMHGMQLQIAVGEDRIDAMHVGDRVDVVSDAVPGMVLVGRIDAVGSQVFHDAGQRVLWVRAVVDVMPKAWARRMHVGMGVQLQFRNTPPPAIHVPIAAVRLHHGMPQLALADRRGWTNVVTGQTSGDWVVIRKGLKPGDRYEVPTRDIL